MSVYFSYFPNVTHTNKLLVDITKRVNFDNTILRDPYAFLPYTIVEDDKPEDIANYYYGSVKYTWLVYLSAGIYDPYFDWPMTNEQFDKYIIKKYAAQANTTGYAVISWTKNTTITDNIVHYYNVEDTDIKISPDSYTLDPNIVADDWEPLRIYEYETELNEDKRVIELLDARYADEAEKQLKALLNGRIR